MVLGPAAAQLKTIFDNRDPTFVQAIMANLNSFSGPLEKTRNCVIKSIPWEKE
jgi:hypothetical protein